MSVFLAGSMRLVWGTVGEVELCQNSHGKLFNSRLKGRKCAKKGAQASGRAEVGDWAARTFSQPIPRTPGTSGRHPLAVKSLGSSDTSLTAPPAALRVRVRAVPAWGALSGWLLGAPHLKSGSAPCPAIWSRALDTCRAKEMAAVSIAGSLVSAC